MEADGAATIPSPVTHVRVRRRRGPFTVNWVLGAGFLTAAAIALIAYTLFTSYAPDTYVFVKYAYAHNTVPTIQLQSLLDNNVIFDALSLAGTWLGFSSSVQYLLMLTGLNTAMLLAKYGYLLRKGRLDDVVVLFAASFYALDLNLFRLNLALIILYVGLVARSRIIRIGALALSGVAHFIPVCVLILKRCRYVPLLLLAIVPAAIFEQRTRLYLYLAQKDFTLYKSLLFVLPFLVCYFDRNFTRRLRDPIMGLAEAFVVAGVIAIFFNTVITARFFELAFILTAAANVFQRFSVGPRTFLMFFAVVAFAQRTHAGIHAGENNFVSEFVLDKNILTWLFH